MNAKNGVKIVKRAERETAETKATAPVKQPEKQPNLTRAITRQVTTWVREFQERRAVEARQNLQILSAGAPVLN